MECPECKDKYNLDTRKPTILPRCFHTFCLACVQALQQNHGTNGFSCPKCREATPPVPNDLPSNDCVLELLKTERAKKLKDTTILLETTIKLQCDLEEMINEKITIITQSSRRQVDAIRKRRESAQEALNLLNSSLGATSAVWDHVCRAVEDVRTSCADTQATDELTLHWGQPNGMCVVAVHRQHGETLRGDFNLKDASGGSALVLAMVAVLERAKLLNEPAWEDEREPLPEGQEINLSLLSQEKGHRVEKEKLLQQLDLPVTALERLYCNVDPFFAEKLLQCHGPTLEKLDLIAPTAAHVQVVTTMPNLRRLEIFYPAGTVEQLRSATPAYQLKLDYLEVGDGYIGMEKILAIIALCGGANNLYTRWHSDWPVDQLVGLLRKRPGRPAFTTPKVIKLWCGDSPRDACTGMCNAVRRGLTGVQAYCREHDPNKS